MKKRAVEPKSFARAERLLARTESLCRDAVEVLCAPAVRRAAAKVLRAEGLAAEAMKLARAPALAKLGVEGYGIWLRPKRFVDEGSWEAAERISESLPVGCYHDFEVLELPDRRYFEHWLVERPRTALADLKRVATLPEDSPELRALRETLKTSAPRKRRGRRRGDW